MIFVGYEIGSKGYRFWDPNSRSIVVSRDVVFDEKSFPNREPRPVAPTGPIDQPPAQDPEQPNLDAPEQDDPEELLPSVEPPDPD